MDESALPRLAFLGPLGSYSHSCAVERFEDSVQYAEQSTIADVFRAVSPEIPFAVIPQENSIHGTVIETYDVLRSPEAGQCVFVRGELALAVQHCLVVRQGVKLEDVQRVMSHEQALGQCSRFLSARLPNATRMKVPSTSAAANAILCCGEGSDEPESAAICSAQCADLFDGLEVLESGIQNELSNTTRFYILSNSLDAPLPGGKKETRRQRALVRIGNQLRHHREGEPPSSTQLSRIVTSTLLTTFGCPALRIDRRPSLNGVPFDDVYFVEVGDLTPPVHSEVASKSCEEEWLQRVQDGIERINATGGEAVILGLW
ncbi:PDT-domain-containing protein [Dichomitus squalens LYAD-421 SS1]|uniref:PDT-domain-containing protein n=1 Tax=Dichomitus squalens TaxID=114155 RepID=A0A4V2K906_9APHY|nr:PDT-domain-containing protein [Dichomitus squalens LYAD-421 SS1]EJF67040.1 PDT-domain-containing protein [Dichomitus squalens LYAD-421 SS1]TBU62038.1 PDT-domain-containing protein [Dichomitus squalens]